MSAQLLVNGEPVLSAVNSATYAVHHSSGRLAAVGPHSAGNVSGEGTAPCGRVYVYDIPLAVFAHA
eukprot:1315178-Pleurochrysis_carterae.AAC.3